MAKPIPLEMPPRDPRQELLSRLQDAPAEHAEALLAGYEVLQGLHDFGILELLRGLLDSGDKVMQTAVDAARAPESVRIIRNVMLIRKMLGQIDPEQLDGFVQALPEALQRAKEERNEDPSLLATLNRFRNKDLLRGISVINSLLEIWGRRTVSSVK